MAKSIKKAGTMTMMIVLWEEGGWLKTSFMALYASITLWQPSSHLTRVASVKSPCGRRGVSVINDCFSSSFGHLFSAPVFPHRNTHTHTASLIVNDILFPFIYYRSSVASQKATTAKDDVFVSFLPQKKEQSLS